ncbi:MULTISPECIES: hypothetical protein [unclassified Roseovarius]|uniref:hypothetical protein n=1 Tax=unclassified Roseovarius TaxID=2614913 RepID=UPI00273D446E|nr:MULTISPECIES: hypothetical protein [unclassified Roseovarius]
MNPVSTQLEMSAASIRLAGYMIESNLRIAQALGEAALMANPFAIPADLRKQVVKPVSRKVKAAAPVAKTAPAKAKKAAPNAANKSKAVAAPKSTPAKRKPVSRVTVAPVPAKEPAAPVKKASKPARPATPKAPAAKPRHAKAGDVAAPAFKSRVARPAAEPKSPAKEAPTTAPVAKVTAPQAKAEAPKPAVAKNAETSAKPTVNKAHRAPSAPPAMPKRDKTPGKG